MFSTPILQFSFGSVLLTHIPRENKKYSSVKKKVRYRYMQTQVAGRFDFSSNSITLLLTSYTDFQNTSSDVWCTIHIGFKFKLCNTFTTVWTALVACGRNALSSCLNTIIGIIAKKNIIQLATKNKLLQKAQSGTNGRGLGYSFVSYSGPANLYTQNCCSLLKSPI